MEEEAFTLNYNTSSIVMGKAGSGGAAVGKDPGGKRVAAQTLGLGHFPGGSVAKTLNSKCRGLRFDPWSGN